MSRVERIPVSAIKEGLLPLLPDLVGRLVPGAQRHGQYWQAPNPTRAEKSRTPFTVWANGAWKEYDSDEKGDVIDMIAYCLRCDRTGAIRWAKDYLGIDRLSDDERRAMAKRALEKAEKRAADADADKERKRQSAFKLWLDAPPMVPGDPAVLYLRDARGIDLFAVPNLVAGEGRFLARTRHWVGKFDAPAMVWPVRTLGAVTGVHLTFLRQTAKGWDKVDHASPRLMLGDVSGGVVYISHGPSGLPPREAAMAGYRDPLILGEGNETGLSLALGVPEARVWATLSLGNMAKAPVNHPCVGAVFVALENDIKSAALGMRDKMLDTLTARLGAAPGQLVPPCGSDFNNTLTGKA